MNDKFFRDNQKIFRSLVNTEAGRFLLGIKDNYPAVKVTPNSVHRFTGKEIIADFWTNQFVAEKIGIPLTKSQIIEDLTYKSFLNYSGLERNRKYPEIYLTSTDFFSDGAWGRLIETSIGGSWATCRNAGTASDGHDANFQIESFSGGGNFQIIRVFSPYNTSSIGGGSTVTSATYKIYRDDTKGGFVNTDSCLLEIIPQNSASNATLADSDYGTVTFSSKGSIAFSATTNNAYNNISITDLTFIATSGETKICLTTDRDLNNSSPTGNNNIAFQKPSETNVPTLTVVYTTTSIKAVSGLAVASIKAISGVAIANVKKISGLS